MKISKKIQEWFVQFRKPDKTCEKFLTALWITLAYPQMDLALMDKEYFCLLMWVKSVFP